MQKVLFVLHYPPPIHGAAMVGEYIRTSSKINSTFECKYINLSTSHKLDEIGKGGFIKFWRFLKIFFVLLRELIVFRPDLSYVTLNSGGVGFLKDSVIVLLIKLFNSKNIVYHFHNRGVERFQNKLLYNFMYKIVFKNAFVILLSKFLIEDVVNYVPEKNIRICANGIPEIKYLDDSTKRKENNKIRLLFLSNLIEEKGVYVLLQACTILKEKNLLFECVLVGNEGNIKPNELIERISLLNLENEVKYLGPKFGDEKYGEYLKADIFIFPTYYSSETFGLVNVEAMQFSLPVISTNVGGIPDVIEDGVSGFLVKTGDSKELAEKISTLIMNPEVRLEMGQKGYKNYIEKFTLAVFEKRLITILKELI